MKRDSTEQIFSGSELLSLIAVQPSLWEDIEFLWPVKTKQRLKTTPGNTYLVLFSNPQKEKIIALAKIIHSQGESGESIGTVHNVIVHPEYRGQGLGRELIQLALEYGQDQGFQRLELTSRPFRIAANALYKKIGFQLQASAFGENGTNYYCYFFPES